MFAKAGVDSLLASIGARLNLPPGRSAIDSLQELLKQFDYLFDLSNFGRPVQHETRHYIPTKGPPVLCKCRCLSPEKLVVLKCELNKLLELGVIVPANSPYCSQVHMVPKKQAGKFRVTGDFRLLNKQTTPDRYAMPFISDVVNFLEGSNVFSSLDLYKSYHQIVIADCDINKTAVITPVGSFALKKMAMGLSGTGQTQCHFLKEVLTGLDFAFEYVDDILISLRDEKKHISHLHQVFQRLDRYGLILNKDKCVFAEKEISFLVHVKNSNNIKPQPNKVDPIKDFPQLHTYRTAKELRFLGLVNYYRRFLKSASQALALLTDLLTKDKVRAKRLLWNNEVANAFETIKVQSADETMLSFSVCGAKTLLPVDSSGSSVGAVLSQVHASLERPLASFFKNFSNVQRTYSAFNREALGAYLVVKHFKYFLEGREFSLFTDHKALVSAIGARMHDATTMQSRYLACISEFTTDYNISWVRKM